MVTNPPLPQARVELCEGGSTPTSSSFIVISPRLGVHWGDCGIEMSTHLTGPAPAALRSPDQDPRGTVISDGTSQLLTSHKRAEQRGDVRRSEGGDTPGGTRPTPARGSAPRFSVVLFLKAARLARTLERVLLAVCWTYRRHEDSHFSNPFLFEDRRGCRKSHTQANAPPENSPPSRNDLQVPQCRLLQ